MEAQFGQRLAGAEMEIPDNEVGFLACGDGRDGRPGEGREHQGRKRLQ
jgi:hypothetical protein